MSATDVQPGDLIAISGTGFLSNMIQLGTLGLPNLPGLGSVAGISHVGVVVPVFWAPRDKQGALLVYESTTFGRPACVRQGAAGPGVQAHHLSTILDAGGRVYRYPLKRELYEHEIWRLHDAAEECLGRPYDFFGAARAWGGIGAWLASQLMERERLANLFCSELVAHVWGQVGIMQCRVSGAWNPNRLCRFAVRHGVCGDPILLT